MKNLKKDTNIIVRFPPSPTGYLHIGNLRVAIFNWLFARHNGGLFLVRVEDTDKERSKKEYVDYMLESLKWLGIDYDGGIVIQSQRVDEHNRMIEKLIKEGKAYRCFCTEEAIEKRKKEKFGYDDLYSGYDGFCAERGITEEDKKKPFVVRFKLPADKKTVRFDDLIRGEIVFELNQFDDFIIARSDGSPMYNFVVIVDDHFMNITHIIRGEDHISNTPKQILLYEAFGFDVPQFAHLPLILGPSGDKLSKRDAAVSVLEYRSAGYLPEALFNYLVRLGWSHGDQEIFTKDELVQYFDLDHVGKKGAIFDIDKLQWLNGVYIREMAADKIAAVIEKDCNVIFKDMFPLWDEKEILKLIDLYKERSKTLREIVDALVLLYDGPKEYDSKAVEKWVDAKTVGYVEALIKTLKKEDDFVHDQLAATIKALCKEFSIKLVVLAQPIRIALVGSSASPGIFDLLQIVGKEESIKRFVRLFNHIKGINLG